MQANAAGTGTENAVGIQTSVGGKLIIQAAQDITISARAEDDSYSRQSAGIEVTGNESNGSSVQLSSEKGSISVNPLAGIGTGTSIRDMAEDIKHFAYGIHGSMGAYVTLDSAVNNTIVGSTGISTNGWDTKPEDGPEPGKSTVKLTAGEKNEI